MMSLLSAHDLAVEAVKKAQKWYKRLYDCTTVQMDYCIGEWIFIRFPAVKTGKHHKLSQPWQGPYHILQQNNPDITAAKVYFLEDGQI